MNLKAIVKQVQELPLYCELTFVARGNSMRGVINDGQTVTVRRIKNPVEEVKIGQVVLCKVKGRYWLHQCHGNDGNRLLIGNARGRMNGLASEVYAVVTRAL